MIKGSADVTKTKKNGFGQKLLALVLAAAMLMPLGSCSSKKGAAEFDTYLESLPARMMNSDEMNLEFLFTDARNYGFSDTLLELPLNTKEDYEESDKQTKQMLDELSRFDYQSLSEMQKLTYDVLKDYLERSMGSTCFYYLDNNYLGSYLGFQAQLPLLLNEYTFDRQNDLDSYFHILETAEETFLQYAQVEKERQTQGVGMSKTILDKVIEQCENMVGGDNSFLITSANEKIDAADFLNDEQKQRAKEKNRSLIENDYIAAYRSLAEELRTITPQNTEDLGLASQKKGKEYYAYLIRSQTGLDMSVKEIKNYLNEKMDGLYARVDAILSEDPKAYQRLQETDLSDPDALHYTNADSFEGMLDYLGEAMKQDYPMLSHLNYRINIVPNAMKDNFSPAAYLQGKIDAPDSAPEIIYINDTFKQNLFSTVAHEGYPGHMYQHTYFKQQHDPTVRYLLDYSGYSEGWATYIENNSWKYAQNEDKALLELVSINSQLSGIIACLLDIGLHYEGWDRQQFAQEAGKYYDLTEDVINEHYNIILETPANYLQYYLTGFKLQDLYDKAQAELGDSFDSVAFNEVLLKIGPAPFSILQTKVDEYIKGAK